VKLREIARYEMEYRLKSGSTWAYAGILFLVAIWMFLATADGAAHANAPERIAGATVLIGLFGLLVTAAIFGDAAVRDVEAGMDPLLYSAPVTKATLLGGRFLGAFAVNAVVMLMIPIGILVATWIASTGAETVGRFHLAAHVQPYFLFQLPNLVLAGAVLFAIGMLTRQVIPVYLGAIGLFIGYVIALNYVGQIDNPLLVSLLDPLGAATLMEVTELWTEAERNSRLVGLPEPLAWNRAIWLAIAAAVLVQLYRGFRFAHPDGGGRRGKARAAVVAPESGRTLPVRVPRAAGSFGLRTTLRQTLAVARNALAEVAASRWWVVVLLACTGLTMLWGWNVGDTVFDTSTWPVTLLVIESVLSSRNAPILYVLIALYAGELVWRERTAGTSQIADAAPVPEGAALLGRFLALAAMLVMFLAATMVGGLLIQALQGYYHFEIGLYLRAVFGMRLADCLLLAALAMTVHVIVNHKYVGHLLVVLAFAAPFALQAIRLIGHHLLLYGTDPGWMYSDMNGFGPYPAAFAWFKAYWAAWALLLLLLAVLFWVRGPETGVQRRLRLMFARFTGPIARTAGIAIVLILGLGGFIFYNTNVLNEYVPVTQVGRRQAEYEKRYGRYEHVAQPVIADVALRVELHPGEQAAELRGTYRLVNRSAGAIDSVHVFLDPDVEARALTWDRPAQAVLVDEAVGYRIFALGEPLEPGASLRLAFDVALRSRGFPNGGLETDVAGNGTYLSRMRMPFIGYQPMLELTDGEARKRFGLAPQPPVPGHDDARARRHRWGPTDADLVLVDAIIGTDADQTAITPGVLRRSWTENGRRYFHYETETPIAFGGTIFSARYAILEDRWRDVALRIFHHPGHADNLDRMLRGMKASLDYYTAQFGPYPYSELRIAEIPRYEGFGVAHPLTIGFTENVFFSRVREGEVDQPFYGTAHEVAHTWWGGVVRGAGVRGAGLLSESLANYSAMMVTEKAYGPEAGERVYDFQMERYIRGRSAQSREVPVLEVEDQPYIAYRKGAIALMTLRDHIGEAALNAALRRYFERHRDAGPPYPTSRDLHAELRAATPDSLRHLLTDWFETVTLWKLKTGRAVAEPAGTGAYAVTLDLSAAKVRADSVGNETEVPMHDLVEVGIFAADGDDGPGAPLYLQRHRIRSGEQTIRVIVPRMPARAGIDPRRRLIERERDDNVVDVEPAPDITPAPSAPPPP
jgi:ABC-type transport system involved in multi-copper enzyme maturation permease subunit